jgi:hypothetical protein
MNDALELAKITILHSPDVHAWPATASITALELKPGGLRVAFTRQDGPDRWPDVLPEEGLTPVQATLWIVLFIASSYWAAAIVELESNGSFPFVEPSDLAHDFYVDPVHYTPMAGHQPSPGETVGFFLTAGSAVGQVTGNGRVERSNIVAVPFPTAAGGSFTFDAHPPDPAPARALESPPVQPAPTPAPAPDLQQQIDDLRARVVWLETHADRVERLAGVVYETARGASDTAALLVDVLDDLRAG